MKGMKIDLAQLLRDKNIKVTSARVAILEAFSLHCDPHSAESLGVKLKSKRINRVTIYRTLALFEEAGLLKRIDLHQDSVHYELAGHHHHHIVCTSCGFVEEFDTCRVDQFSNDVLKSSSRFNTVEHHSLELFGTCTVCA